ncbi:valerianol synthase TPS8-like [Daucus carota subsp. sativus]|uniref:valerianol synthase TPS8-like n=1 Tax=Daucus carota subsp. sativus TaxID=79200 RepID=UPI0030831BC2
MAVLKLEAYSKERDALKSEVKNMLVFAASGKMTEELILINTIERLGVAYNFQEYIEERLVDLCKNCFETDQHHDLFTTSTCFRIFRQHGYNITSDIFSKFKIEGKFDEAISKDQMSTLSLFEAAQLRITEEAILDEALAFTTSHLNAMAKSSNLESGLLSRQIMHALEQPLHKGLPRIEAKHFISFYEEDPSRNDLLLKFAKLDFNLVQMLYKQELSQVKRWWADLDFDSKLPQFRSRVVEGYFLDVSILYEPCYAVGRIMFTKVLCALSIADDLYNAYGTMDELDLYTKAIERFDFESVEGLQGHSKECYITCLNVLREFDDEIIKMGRYYDVSYLKEVFKANLICYHIEAKWREINYVPTFKEYFPNALTSSGVWILGVASILGMGHVDTVKACEWALTKPKVILVAEANGCIINDIAGFEEHNRAHVATSIDCYIKEHGVSKERAVAELDEMIDNTWKEMSEACLRPTPVPMQFITVFLNLMRVCYVTYKAGDGYTHPEQQLKDEINFILDPIVI